MTNFYGLGGGLREIDDSLLDGYQPFSTAIVGTLAHNQQLIQDTMVPRHLINDFYPRDEDGYALTVLYDSYGAPISCWGSFSYQPGYELQVKVRARKLGDEYFDSTMYFISTPTAPDLDGYWGSLLDSVPEENYITWHLDSDVISWFDGYMSPNNGNGNTFYLSLWAKPELFTGGVAMLDITNVCVRERRIRV